MPGTQQYGFVDAATACFVREKRPSSSPIICLQSRMQQAAPPTSPCAYSVFSASARSHLLRPTKTQTWSMNPPDGAASGNVTAQTRQAHSPVHQALSCTTEQRWPSTIGTQMLSSLQMPWASPTWTLTASHSAATHSGVSSRPGVCVCAWGGVCGWMGGITCTFVVFAVGYTCPGHKSQG